MVVASLPGVFPNPALVVWLLWISLLGGRGILVGTIGTNKNGLVTLYHQMMGRSAVRGGGGVAFGRMIVTQPVSGRKLIKTGGNFFLSPLLFPLFVYLSAQTCMTNDSQHGYSTHSIAGRSVISPPPPYTSIHNGDDDKRLSHLDNYHHHQQTVSLKAKKNHAMK